MVLPSKSCLQKYVRNYKSSFGFNDDVFAAIAEKTKTMDAFQRHRGLLIGDFQQILGVFGSHSNVKAGMLAKIIIDATLAAEKSGLFVDFVTTDGASWNRSMWRGFGVKGTAEKTVCKVKHPADDKRSLHFLSDFPHLVKCVRNSIVSTGLRVPEGKRCLGSTRLRFRDWATDGRWAI
ncbi:hypothetical protein HPB47_015342 [Ixodes persulcatus]|uniref:Uncharacterized protein n=1 Tax=Ixodes persulcatus TaxID=34615 RepID=A0AC60QXA2_IXOPE|nr:hypothetical protein HPB47_015342 [Ixodes persulcatus]